MKKLEKILEEMEKLKEMYKESSFALLDKGNLPCEYDKSDIESAKVQAISEAVAIIRKHMSGKDTGVPTNNGWIPVDDRLPKTNDDGMSEDVLVSFAESNYIMIAFYNSDKRRWNIHGTCPYIGRVIAWHSLPGPYRPEMSDK